MTRYLRLLLPTCLLLSSFGYASNKAHLEEAYAKRSDLIGQLAQLETQEGQLAQSLKHTRRAVANNTWAQRKLKRKQTLIWQQLNDTIKTINNMLQVNYLWLQQPRLKWLLSDESHESLNELDHYQKSIESTRTTEMQRLRSLEATLIKNQEALEEKANQLKTLLTQQKKAFKRLKQTEKDRRDVISHLDSIIQEERLKNEPSTPPALSDDAEMSDDTSLFQPKSLPWPTLGKVYTYYGDTYHHTNIKQHGIVINAPMGRSVRAIADGDVVFSRWLPGYGHLLIINHKNGYLSLYGRNRYLEKNVGDHVHAKEEIAIVGNSGGYSKPGLYFELRYMAHPVNPLAWLKKMSRHHTRKKHHDSSHTTHKPTGSSIKR